MKTKKNNKIFLIGILGTGMTALAVFLKDMGYIISGSDKNKLEKHHYLYRFKDHINIYEDHRKDNIIKANPAEVVYSKAINPENPELKYAMENNIRIYSRPEKIAKIASLYRLALITGTHGKSSITALSSYMSEKGSLPVSYIIGAVPYDIPPAGYKKNSEFLILEGDESNRDILALNPEILLISSLEWDHPEIYTRDELFDLFENIINKKSIKTIIYNKDYNDLDTLIKENKKNIEYLNYTTQEHGDYTLNDRKLTGEFILEAFNEMFLLKSDLIGLFNIENTIASFALMRKLGLNPEVFVCSIADYRGISKRLEILKTFERLIVYIDYSHHPTEIRKALEAIREHYTDKKIILVFEPHMPSRMKNFLNDFFKAFSYADETVITEIFQARPDPNAKWTMKQYFRDLKEKSNISFIEDHKDIKSYIDNRKDMDAVVVISSAGRLADFIRESFL